MSWPDGFFVNYDYNWANDLTGIRENGATAWSLAWFGYDNLGRRTAQGNANGSTTSWGYDGASRLTSLSHDLAGTANDLTLGFSYNPAGQIVTRMMSNPAYAYTPGTGNTAYANNGKNQVTSVNGAGVSYDGRGNIVQIGGTNTQTYNGLNELTAANTTSGWLGMSYDPSGRLYQTTDGGGAATRFLYDGQQVVGEYNTSGGLLRRYVPGLGLDNVVTAYEGAGYDRRWLLSDERRSVVSISDGQANALATNTYDEYGQPGSGNSGRFQYTGQMWLPEAQLYHYRARAYAPQLGRFMQTDPIGYSAGANIYAYVGADPMNWVDPWGLVQSDGAPSPSSGCTSTHMRDRNTGRYIPGTWSQACATGGGFGGIGGFNGRGGSSGPRGASSSGGQRLSPAPQTETCRIAQAQIERNANRASSSLMRSARWNSMEALRYEEARARGSETFGGDLSIDINGFVEGAGSAAGVEAVRRAPSLGARAGAVARVLGPLPAAASLWNELWKWESEDGARRAAVAGARIQQLENGC